MTSPPLCPTISILPHHKSYMKGAVLLDNQTPLGSGVLSLSHISSSSLVSDNSRLYSWPSMAPVSLPCSHAHDSNLLLIIGCHKEEPNVCGFLVDLSLPVSSKYSS